MRRRHRRRTAQTPDYQKWGSESGGGGLAFVLPQSLKPPLLSHFPLQKYIYIRSWIIIAMALPCKKRLVWVAIPRGENPRTQAGGAPRELRAQLLGLAHTAAQAEAPGVPGRKAPPPPRRPKAKDGN